MCVLMPAAWRLAPTASPSTVFEPEPESPGEMAPNAVKYVERQLIEAAARGVPPAPMPAPWAEWTTPCTRFGFGFSESEPLVKSALTPSPVARYMPIGPPQKAIVGVTR